MALLLVLLILLPIVEMTLFIEIGTRIGALETVALTFLTAIVGLWLVRQQGLSVAVRMRDAMVRGEPPLEEMLDGFFLLVAGLSLLIPGFLTDTFGGVLLIPPVRRLFARLGVARLLLGYPKPRAGRDREGNMIIEGQYHVEREEEEPQQNPPDGNGDSPQS